eukprot:Platyproteum_vivax@DN11540_c0_g1_i1.p1
MKAEHNHYKCDECKLEIGGGKEPLICSSSTLCSISPVFQKMLNSEFVGGAEECLSLPDDSFAAFQVFLRLAEIAIPLRNVDFIDISFERLFFYTNFNLSMQLLLDTYKTADKYQALDVCKLLTNIKIDIFDEQKGPFFNFMWDCLNKTVKPIWSKRSLSKIYLWMSETGSVDMLADMVPDFERSCIVELFKIIVQNKA